MLTKLIAVGIALLFAVAVSASDVQEMAPPPEAISGLKGIAGDEFEDVSEIINGFPVPNARLSYYTYILMHDASVGTAFACGGSLISDDIVLTAAHCLFDFDGKPWSRIVVFGNLKDGFHPGNPFNPHTGQWRDAVIRYAAPNFNIEVPHNDVALLKLAGPIGSVSKPKLNSNGAIPHTGWEMFVVGYGFINTEGPPATDLMAVDIINQAPDVCADHLAPYYKESIMICGNNPNKGVCVGDDGGPLFLPYSQDASDDVLIGVFSFRLGECADRTPTLSDGYARVSAFYGLIKNFVCTKSSFPHTSPLCR